MLTLLACLGCGDDAGPARYLVLDRLLVEFPDEVAALEWSRDDLVDEGRILEQAWAFDLLGDTIAVSDRLTGRVHVFTLDGEHLRTLGAPSPGGTGPDLLVNPTEVWFSADGSLWVDDRNAGRVVRFSPALELAETVPVAGSYPGGHFAVDPVLGIVTGSQTPGFLLAAHGEEVVDIPAEVPIPEGLIWPQLASAGMGEIVLLDGERLDLWRIRLEYDPPRIVGMEDIPIPSWLLSQLRSFKKELLKDRGHQMQAFNGIRVAPDGVWLEPGAGAGAGIWGIRVPFEDDGTAVTVLRRGDPSEPPLWRSLIRDGVVHTLSFDRYARHELREVDRSP